ncbi:hypothetical protein [Thalassobaculum sp.]|uniref:hypothetical protein n=1 Tax=Thalassobaculum sp. TaxID=2022740 RepID=UPI0032EDBE51
MSLFATLMEIVMTRPSDASVRVERAATANLIGLRGGARVDFPGRLLGEVTIEWSLFAPGRLDGPSQTSFGSVRLNNQGERFDDLTPWIGGLWTIKVWQVTIASGAVETPIDLDALDPVFTGRCAAPQLGTDAIEIPLRSPMRGFDLALETDTFAGDNVGTTGDEGELALAGVVKPTTLGLALHVPAPASNEEAGRHLVNNGPVEDVVEAYANGDAAAFTEDLANGRYGYSVNVKGLVRTADVKGDKPDGIWRSTAGALITHLATTRAGIASVNATELAAVEAAAPQVVGFYAGARTTIRVAADFLARGARIYYLTDGLGTLRLGVLEAPDEEPVLTVKPHMLINAAGGRPFTLVPLSRAAEASDEDSALLANDDGSLPVWKVTVRGRRYWIGNRADNQIAAGLTFEQIADLKREWREEPAADEAIKTAYPDADQLVIDTAFVDTADMQDAAASTLAIRRWPQQILRASVWTRYAPGWLLGATVAFEHPRLQLAAGPTFRVLRRLTAGPVTTFDLWRPVVS